MREMGLEPIRDFSQEFLRLSWLPVSPLPRSGLSYHEGTQLTSRFPPGLHPLWGRQVRADPGHVERSQNDSVVPKEAGFSRGAACCDRTAGFFASSRLPSLIVNAPNRRDGLSSSPNARSAGATANASKTARRRLLPSGDNDARVKSLLIDPIP